MFLLFHFQSTPAAADTVGRGNININFQPTIQDKIKILKIYFSQGLYIQDGKSAGTAIFDQTKPLYLTNQNSLYFCVNQ